MNTFWGCDTEALTALSEVVTGRAEQLRRLATALRASVHVTTWCGPDAQEWRRRTDEAVQRVISLVETLRRLAELLASEAEEQIACSRPENGAAPAAGIDPSLVWARLPRLSGASRGSGPLGGLPPLDEWGPLIGGPIMADDPGDLFPDLGEVPDIPGLRPQIWDPYLPREPWPLPWGPPAARDLPEGEDFSLDPEILREAQRDRRLALGSLPIVGPVQLASGVHEGVGDAYDRAEQMLEDAGLGGLTPVVSVARLPHTVTGAVLGEKSVFGQAVSSVDQGIANVMQTGEEVSAAIGDGDLAGAVRAGERGIYRHTGAVADLVTATAVPAAAETASDILGTGAELTGRVSPEAAAPLREAAQSVREAGQAWERTHDRLTDPERYYDLRRQYAPMPWDPR